MKLLKTSFTYNIVNKVQTKYALILNPDSICTKNFFTNLKKYLRKIKEFHLIGCSYTKNKNYMLPGIYEATELVVSRAITQDDYNKIEEFLKDLKPPSIFGISIPLSAIQL